MAKAKGRPTASGAESASPEEARRRNLEAYGSRVRFFRRRAGFSAEQLADRLGVGKSSVRNWECGLTRPDPEYLVRMFSLLNVEPNEFFGITGVGSLLTGQERRLLDLFRSLDEAGQEDLISCAGGMGRASRLRRLRAARGRVAAVPFRGRAVAAGEGEDWDSSPEEETVLLLAGGAVTRANEVFLVSGQSMEPQFEDRDRVLVEYCSSLRNGDIGIFYVPGRGGVIKQVAWDRLHSLNPDYDDIFPYEDGARVVGRVLGKITKDMIPGPEELALYQEAEEALQA